MADPLTQHLVDTTGRASAMAGATYTFKKHGGWMYFTGGIGCTLIHGNGNVQVMLFLRTDIEENDTYYIYWQIGAESGDASGTFDTPFADMSTVTARIELYYPMRLMADITTWDKWQDYTYWENETNEVIARWGPMWQVEGEVPDLLPFTNADLAWWYWPYDEAGEHVPGKIRVTVGSTVIDLEVSDATTPFAQAGGAMSASVQTGDALFSQTAMGVSGLVNNCGDTGLPEKSETVRLDSEHPHYGHVAMQVEQTATGISVAPVIYDSDPWQNLPVEAAGCGITVGDRFLADVTATVTAPTGTEWADAVTAPSTALKLLATHGPERYPPNELGERDEGLRVAKVISAGSEDPDDSLDFLVPGQLYKNVQSYSASASCNHAGVPYYFVYEDSAEEAMPSHQGLGWTHSLTHMANMGLDRNAFRALLDVPGLTWTQGAIYYGPPLTAFDAFGSIVEGWTAVDGETLSIDTGRLKIVKSGSKAITKTFLAEGDTSREIWFDTISALVIDLDCPTGTACKLTIGTKEWTHDHDGEPWVVHLCLPTNATGVDTSSSRYEREFANGAASDSEGGWGWGIGRGNQTLRLDFSTSEDVFIESISAHAETGEHSVITAPGLIVEDARFRVDDDAEGLKRWAQPYLMHIIDGRIEAQEEAGILREPDLAAYEDTYVADETRTIDAVLGRMQSGSGYPGTLIPGRRATARASRGNGLVAIENAVTGAGKSTTEGGVEYYKPDQYCRGGRAIWDLKTGNASGTGTGGTAVTLTGQVVADRIGMGFGVHVPLTCRMVLWGGVNGVVLNGDAAVIASKSDVVQDTAELTGARWYDLPDLSLPWASKTAPWQVQQVGSTEYGEWDKAIQGVLLRLCLIGGDELPTDDGCDYHVDQLSGHSIAAYGTKEGLIKTVRSFDYGKSWEPPVTIPNVAGSRRPAVIVNEADKTRPWGVVYDTNGSASIAWSTDGFYNQTPEVLMTGVTHMRAAVHPLSGVMLIAGYRIADGKIVTAYSTDYGATLSAVSEVCLADEAGFGLHYAPDAQALWTLIVRAASWSADAVYAEADRVIDPVDGKVYRCKSAVGPSATTPSADATHWELASANTISTYWSTDNGQNWQLAA